MIPFEFTIKGPPISHQAKSKSKNRWKTAVAAAAKAKIKQGDVPTIDEVAIRITYYYEGDTPDVDNIIKPIQDALIGLVYVDDSQVIQAVSSKARIDGSFTIRGASAELLLAFSNKDTFVHILITSPPDMSVLP
ncbi:RusA family crossover junction endodeoxyribonuclease [Marinicella sediminis]|uniref:RusA family crossover junction endodeoxyribonuclease n=1 Tax=Marinicella sediminis TaxID=1792834 RepID=A0ABV7JCQ0_9GAMM|nr:RusA family crossover junction endodeoxyribonuclease [Marinicella sediminis]